MRSLLLIFALTLAGLTASIAPSRAEPVIVTVTGEVGKTNRGAFEPFGDALFDANGLEFERAYGFTRSELKALPQSRLTVRYDNWPREVTLSGPLLKDVLAAVEAGGDTVLVRAVDGYAPEFSRADIEAGQFVLALEADGTALATGGRGPAWLVFPPSAGEGEAASDDGLTWAVFHIEVQ